MKRRDFLKYLGVGGAGFGLGFIFKEKTKPPGAKLIPYLIPPEDVVPGVANWYASLCTQCLAGCGILVRVMEGRAKKVEGNPLHPISKGRLCARGQASLQALYNPDRIKGPLKRSSPRGGGDFTEISWDEGLSILGRNLSELKVSGQSEKLYFLAPTLRGHLDILIKDFMGAFGSPNYIQHELFQNRTLAFANTVSMGITSIPYYDIENTKYLLSFGADFSSTWLSPVNFSCGYGSMRQGGGGRGKLVSVEPRMSLTGANADEWVPVRPGAEGILALSIASEIIEKGYYRGPDISGWKALLSRYNPKDASGITDVSEEKIRAIAKEFAATRPSLAIGGENTASYQGGISNLVAVNILNHLAGNIGIKGGVIANPEVSGGMDFKNNMTGLIEGALAGHVKTLIVYNTNPFFTTPPSAKAKESLGKVPLIVSLSSFMDETTAMADLVLPSNTSFEDWGDDFAEPGVGKSVYTIMQPAVNRLFNTRGAGDTVLSLAKGIGGKVSDKLPWDSFADYLKSSWNDMYVKNKEMSASAATFDRFWEGLLKNGGWWGTASPEKKVFYVSKAAAEKHLEKSPSVFEGEEGKYPFYLILYPHSGHLDGRGANLSWLQELPDPMTSVVWGSSVEVNPETARRLGIKEGELVAIESPFGKIEAPAYLYPGIRPDTVAIAIGQGHNVYGRYARKRGANPLEILPFREDKMSGEMALNSTRVRISPTGVAGKMVKMEGQTKELGRDIVQTVSREEFEKMTKEIV